MGQAFGGEQLSDDNLAIARDRDLEPARRSRIDAHLATCPDCRRRLAASQQPSRLLQAQFPVFQNPGAWEVFAARTADRKQRWTAGLRLVPTAGLIALILLVFAGTVQLQRTAPGREMTRPLRHVATTQPGLGPLSFPTVEPLRLPLGLVQSERSTPVADRLELLYRNETGLALLVAQSPINGAESPEVPKGPGGRTRVIVGDTSVLALDDSRPRAVAGLLWDRRDLRFELLVTEAPPDGLPLADGARIVEALMAAQDAALG